MIKQKTKNKKKNIIIAVPKGRILEELIPILNKINIMPDEDFFDKSSRRLMFNTNNINVSIIKVRSFDVANFVAFGGAHIGVVGLDVIKEFSYDEIISSRDATERFLSTHLKPSKIGVLGNKDEELNIKNSITIDLAKDIEQFDEMDTFIFLGTSYWDSDFQDLLKDSLTSNPRPFFVSNPDIVAPHKDFFSIEPGYFTLKLINEGINLPLWFGKPFSTIFEMALEKVQFITGSSINMSRIGMVGDTLHTDILGANSIGIKSVLMTNYGLLRDQNIASVIKKTGIIPDYLIEGP